MTRGRCHAIGCRASILPTEIFCTRHLLMVESDTRTVLGRTFRPLQQHQSATFLAVLDRAVHEVLYFTTSGHPVPRDRPFEWDDGPELL